jgi:hypothetical protein
MLINRADIERLTSSDRKWWATILTIVGCTTAFMLYPILEIMIKDYLLDKRFETQGVTVYGEIKSTRYYEAKNIKNPQRFTGHYPNVSYAVGTQTFVFQSSLPKPLNKRDADRLIGQQPTIIYLKDDPSKARISKWHESVWGSLMPIFSILMFVLVFCCLFVIAMWPKKTMRHSVRAKSF